jgi:GNAT superfamily N-acetyltransferase
VQSLSNAGPFVFEKLQSHHDRAAFNCGAQALNDFLARRARQNADRNLGVTHVAVTAAGDPKILAYYTLVTRTIEVVIVPQRKLPPGEVGVVLRGRLGVDREAQGRGLGRMCVLRAIQQVAKAAEEIGIYALVLDAKDDKAKAWYDHLGFGFNTPLDDPNHLYITVETIRQLLA